jgi:hypothetical protein
LRPRGARSVCFLVAGGLHLPNGDGLSRTGEVRPPQAKSALRVDTDPLAAADDLVSVARNSGVPNGVPLVSALSDSRLWACPALRWGCYFWEDVISRKGGSARTMRNYHFRVERLLHSQWSNPARIVAGLRLQTGANLRKTDTSCKQVNTGDRHQVNYGAARPTLTPAGYEALSKELCGLSRKSPLILTQNNI